MPENFSTFDNQQWLEFVNNSSTPVPAYGIVRVTGVAIVEPGHVVLTVDQPNTFGCQANCFVNGPVAVTAGQYGYGTRSGPMVALYDPADGAPAFGDAWGPRPGTWKLKKQTGGFFCLGPPTNSTSAVALFAPLPMLTFRGKTIAAAINKGASGTINIFTGSLGSETDSGQSMPGVYNRYANAAQGKWVTCGWNYDNQGWELIDLEC